jgi:hypothetical protein
MTADRHSIRANRGFGGGKTALSRDPTRPLALVRRANFIDNGSATIHKNGEQLADRVDNPGARHHLPCGSMTRPSSSAAVHATTGLIDFEVMPR